MQQGSIASIHIARVKGTPSDPVQEATAIAGMGIDGDRSCYEGNIRQVLFMDKETLDDLELTPGQIKENITTSGVDMSQAQPGQVFSIGNEVKMEEIPPGLGDKLNGRRGMLAMVINGGTLKVGDPISLDF